MDGSDRQPKFILPAVSDRLERGLAVDGLALVCAFWCRYCYGETESGAIIPPNDAGWVDLQQRARAARQQPAKWLEMSNIFGKIGMSRSYSDAFAFALNGLWQNGTRWTLMRYLERAA
jgi:mannitol 2-dehydrogenase